ncbi:MAG: hypothetical protein HKN21_12890 [Candidatus Eisenbacteria bacterium]|uniref:Orc1-like AAA ATPase domain-containing protein n=1 Tax=Eiseniibacteriota bacterium TaxID=2212470 RepID=A0A7Y2E9E5_UNCEI|nr:hypothetical protein [Candidatus Eisenbacteria bacterium]
MRELVTHRGAPFVGRERTLGLLEHEIREHLFSKTSVLCLAGAAGVGRRRLLRHGLRRGPDAEILTLAPDDTRPHWKRWLQSELTDLLDSYPEVTVPSWALHTLSLMNTNLRSYAQVPVLAPEPLETDPELLGAALACVFRAVASRVPLLINVGLWPDDSFGDALLNRVSFLTQTPGVLLLAAVEDEASPNIAMYPQTRVLLVPPLNTTEIRQLCDAWKIPDKNFAPWLARVSKGNTFFAQEILRWLEEMGHVQIDDDRRFIKVLADPLELPLPMHLSGVMEMRFRRLTPAAQYLLHQICHESEHLQADVYRNRFEGSEEHFDAALSQLRRRGFLLRQSTLQGLKPSSFLWRSVAREPSRRRFKRKRLPHHALVPFEPPRASTTPLAKTDSAIEELRVRVQKGERPIQELSRLYWASRSRTGLAWDGVRGRIYLLAGKVRQLQGKPVSALDWVRRGRALLAPDVFPALRRELGTLALDLLHAQDRAQEVADLRVALFEEAQLAGHFHAAAGLEAGMISDEFILGDIQRAKDGALAAEARFLQMGHADLSEWMRFLSKACVNAETSCAPEPPPESEEEEETPRERPPEEAPTEPKVYFTSPLWIESQEIIHEAKAILSHTSTLLPPRVLRLLESLQPRLEAANYLPLLLDVLEIRLLATSSSDDREGLEVSLNKAANLYYKMGLKDRGREFANALRESPPAEVPAFARLFRPFMIRLERPQESPSASGLRLFLFGPGYLQPQSAAFPLSQFPEWWRRLLGHLIASEVTEIPVSRLSVSHILTASGEPKDPDILNYLREANGLLRTVAPRSSELLFRDDELTWARQGVSADVLDAVSFWEDGRRLSESGLREQSLHALKAGLDLVQGPILPQFQDDPVIHLANKEVATLARESLGAYLSQAPENFARNYPRWREGLSQLIPWNEVVHPTLQGLDWPRLKS